MLLIWVGFGSEEGRVYPDKPSPDVGQDLADVVVAGAEHGKDSAFRRSSGQLGRRAAAL